MLPRFEEKSEPFLSHFCIILLSENCVQMISKEISNVQNLNLLIMPNIVGIATVLVKAQDSTGLDRWAEE